MVSKVYPIASRVPHMLVVLAIALMLQGHAMEDSAQEKQKCVEQLTGISTCLPYVGGSAKAPTPDCCSGLVQAIKSNQKCICIIINDRNDPDLGLNINITLALGLPSLCKAPGNFSLCPALLHLDPKSPEAQAFNQRNGSGSPSAQGNSQNGNSQRIDKTAIKQNGASYKGKILLKSLVTIAGLLIWFF